ncbi:hypothetical protein [Nocardia gamkensis]|uniref:Uncharacterized protein n=1 Tax=Nocardia gamkensis TaxID=352869 RepID=A0A7X6L178_9NOCA|nr:hypothetical protein [Nocardia gamkensis]NKY25833.1 hypothetical protein [Nocardia gamkensis]NQE68981.1 hypothetical protein [Nocardia gamkensis]
MEKVLTEFRQRTAARSYDEDRDPVPPDAAGSRGDDVEPCCRVFSSSEEVRDSDLAELGPTHPISADLVGRTVAGLAIVSQLLRNEAPVKGGRDSLCDPEVPTQLIVEWGISLAWADNPAVTYADEALIDNTLRTLASGASSIGIGSERVYQGDLVQLHHTLIDTIAALRAPLWRHP